MSYIGKIQIGNGVEQSIATCLYGTCETEAATAAKKVVCSDFDKLLTGVTIHVKFTYSNTAENPTLNVNFTGAKGIYCNDLNPAGTTIRTSWYDGAIISFTYDGTYWIMNDWLNLDYNKTYTFSNGTNCFYVTPSGGSKQTVTVTPSITNNITGSGTNGCIAKFNGANTITNGSAIGASTTTFLRNDGNWSAPVGAVSSVAGKTGAVTLSASDCGALPSSTTYAGSATAGGQATSTCLYTSRQTSANLSATGTPGMSHFLATSSMTTGKPDGDAHIIHMSWDNTNGYDSQLANIHGGNYHLEFRSQNGGTWQDWKTVLDSGNLTNYVVAKNGNAAAASKLVDSDNVEINAGYGSTHGYPDIPVFFSSGIPKRSKIQIGTGVVKGDESLALKGFKYAYVVIWRVYSSTYRYWEGYVNQWGNVWAKSASSTTNHFDVSFATVNNIPHIYLYNNTSNWANYILVGCGESEDNSGYGFLG